MKTRQVTEFKETEIGKIPTDWEVKQLQEISKVVDSAHITPKYSPEGYSMVRVKDIKKGFLDLKESLKVSEDVYKEFTKNHTPKRDDIVMGRVGTYGIVSFVGTDTPFCLGQNTVVIHSEINHFIYHALNSKFIQKQIEERVGGSTQKTISLKNIRELLVLKPTNVEETNQIAKILFDLEMKLENLQNQNKILEQIAQTIFKSWFVDFDGVTEFEDSELGKIPKGWKAGNLGDICEIIMGSSPPGKSYNEKGDGEIFFQGKTDFGDFFPNPRIYCSMPKRFAEKNDVLFTVRAPVGSINVAKEKYCIGRGLASLRLKENHGCFLYFLLKSLESEWSSFESEGTVFGSINKDNLNELKIIISPTKIRTKFNISMNPVYNKIWENNENLQVLTKTRDTLLPKLMSGEIRV